MDATKRPLLIPPEFATYAEHHGIFDLYKRILESLLIQKPEDPLVFIKDFLKQDNDDVPQIIILGPPAAGKESISKLISVKLKCAHLSPENMIQDAKADFKREVQKYKQTKKPIPTDLWLEILEERLNLFDCLKKGWVMDGFPQTKEQALALQAKGIYPKHFVHLDAPDTVLIERASGKRLDPNTGEVYHTTFDWPSNTEVANRLQIVPGNTEDEIVEKLVEYHRHIDGIVHCFSLVHKVINADQPKTDVFSQAFTFIRSKNRSAAPHTPRIVLLGVTGSGKAVQAALVAVKYNVVNISCGQLIKQEVMAESKLGLACKSYVEKDMAVPDSIVLNVLKERLGQLDCVSRGWILHGYPKTREQAEQLAHAGFIPNRVFFLDVPNDSVLERLTLRATDPVTGERYHMLYNPPHSQEVKDRLSIHPKDTEEKVKRRLSEFSVFSEELSDYYIDAQHINGDQDPHTVFECIESMIVNPLPKIL